MSKPTDLRSFGMFSAREIPDFERAPLVVAAAVAELGGLDRDTAFSLVDRAVLSGEFSAEASDAWYKGHGTHSVIEFEEAFSLWLRNEVEPIESKIEAIQIVMAYALQRFVENPACREAALECVTQVENSRAMTGDEAWIAGNLYWFNLTYTEVLNARFDEQRIQAEFAKLDAKAMLLAQRWLRDHAVVVRRVFGTQT